MHVVSPLFNNVHSSPSFLITSQHPHQRVWAVARSLSGKGNEMTPRHERKSLRTCTHTTSSVYWEKLVVYFPAMGVTLAQL